MKLVVVATLLSMFPSPQLVSADDKAPPAPQPTEAREAIEITTALLIDLSTVLERGGRAADPKRPDPAWFRGLSLTREKFDALYDEVARAQHAVLALYRLDEERRGIEALLAALGDAAKSAVIRAENERRLSEVKAEATALAPASDVERRNREMMRRSTLPRLELRRPLVTPKPPAAPSDPGWPFVKPGEKPASPSKLPADPPPPEPRKPLVKLTTEVVADYLRIRTQMREAGRTEPESGWFDGKALDLKRFPEVDAEVRFQLTVLRGNDAWAKERAHLEKTMEEIEPLLLSSTGPGHKNINDHYFALYELRKAGDRRQAARDATTADGRGNLSLVGSKRPALEALDAPPPGGK